MASLWQPSIPPRRSILVYKILSNNLPTEDNLRLSGMVLVSHYSMCNKALESVTHLFFQCDFAARVCGWLLDSSRVNVAADSDLNNFIKRLVG